MSNESSYIFMLRAGGSELEVSHNEQSGDVHISEAQIFLKGDHVEGGCLFFIDEVYDMDKLMSYLSEIREKMVRHYKAKPAKSLAEAIASGPYCTQCGNPQTKEEIGARIALCFDCEKKQIIQAADSFKPVVCMVCEGQFDNLLQKQLGICGKCMMDQAKKDKRNVGNYVEAIEALTEESKKVPKFSKVVTETVNFTDEQSIAYYEKFKSSFPTKEEKELIDGVPKRVETTYPINCIGCDKKLAEKNRVDGF